MRSFRKRCKSIFDNVGKLIFESGVRQEIKHDNKYNNKDVFEYDIEYDDECDDECARRGIFENCIRQHKRGGMTVNAPGA